MLSTTQVLQISILPKVMADRLCLEIEPSEDSFTFVDCSRMNSGGIIRHFEVQIGNVLVLVDFHVLDNKLNENSSLLLWRAFMATVGVVFKMQTKKLCLTLIDPNFYYDPVRIVKSQTSYIKFEDDPGFVATCYSEAECEPEAEASIDSQQQPSFDNNFVAKINEHHEASIE